MKQSTSQLDGTNAELRVSVIIPTRDRAATLEGMLSTLLAQTVTPDEIIVIDQSVSGETRALIRALSAQAALNHASRLDFVYVCDPALIGAGPARNRGIELSRYPILVFLDDDLLLEEQYLEELLSVYDRDPSVGGVSGIITNYPKPPLRSRFFEGLFCLGPFHDERLPIYWNADQLRTTEPIGVRKITGCVMSLRRSALLDERFDESYAGRGEDVDLSWRVSRLFPIVLAPKARLIHRSEVGGPREHWLASMVTAQHYLYHKLWRSGVRNRVCFAWLNCGLLTVAIGSSILKRSLAPLRALLLGIRRLRDFRSTSFHTSPSTASLTKARMGWREDIR